MPKKLKTILCAENGVQRSEDRLWPLCTHQLAVFALGAGLPQSQARFGCQEGPAVHDSSPAR